MPGEVHIVQLLIRKPGLPIEKITPTKQTNARAPYLFGVWGNLFILELDPFLFKL